MNKTFIFTKPTKVCLDKQEIKLSEFDFKNKKNTNTWLSFDQIEEIAFISDNSSITKAALKNLEGKNISFISKGKPIATVFWLNNQNKLHHYSQKMACLPKSKKWRLGYTFCKAVSLGRIYEIRRLNEKRNDKFLEQRLKQMMELENRISEVYKDSQALKGIEGNIAKHFFACIRHLLPKEVGFKERNPENKDLYNSLLNASHGLLRAKVAKALWAKGLNTSFGFLHFQNGRDKPFLVWDFAEFWIPYIDKLCFYAVSKGLFKEKYLIKSKSNTSGKWLNDAGWRELKRLFKERLKDERIVSKVNEFADYLDKKRRKFGWTVV